MKFRLAEVVIAGLYKDLLVLTEENPQDPKQSLQQVTDKKAEAVENGVPAVKKWFLGDNKRNILLLLKDDSAVHINDEWLTTLTKLLTACKLNLGDVAIINHLRHNMSFNDLQAQLQPQTILMFDVSTHDIQLPFNFPHYQVQQYSGCTFMTAPAITLAADNSQKTIENEKRKLWEKLKVIFNV